MEKNNLTRDFICTLRNLDSATAYFLCQQISRMMEKNKYGLFFDRNKELTDLGEVLAGIFELILVYGVLSTGV